MAEQQAKPVVWEALAPPRLRLLLYEDEKGLLSPSVWIQKVSPRWKVTLVDLVLNTAKERVDDSVMPTSSSPRSRSASNASAAEAHIDTLVAALIELWNGIIFYKASSHNVSELLKQAIELCARELKKADNQPVQLNEATALSAVIEGTELKPAVLDSLRWAVEYAFDGLHRLLATIPPDKEKATTTTAPPSSNQQQKTAQPSPVGTPNQRPSSSTPQRPTPQPKQQSSTPQQQSSVQPLTASQVHSRILSVLEAVEKSGILTKAEIIGTIPYTQLDQLNYVTTKEGTNLLKLVVRTRTKDLFTLQVHNLEAENPAGYAQLHVLFQTFLAHAVAEKSEMDCRCVKKSVDDNNSDDGWFGCCSISDCQSLCWLEGGILDLVGEFSLCANRVVEILLIYWQHWLFVLRHELLRLVKRLVSKEKLEEVGFGVYSGLADAAVDMLLLLLLFLFSFIILCFKFLTATF